MSKLTILEDVLNFTEIDSIAAMSWETASDRQESECPEDRSNHRPLYEDGQLDEEQRISRDLTSILVSGHLPE